MKHIFSRRIDKRIQKMSYHTKNEGNLTMKLSAKLGILYLAAVEDRHVKLFCRRETKKSENESSKAPKPKMVDIQG